MTLLLVLVENQEMK